MIKKIAPIYLLILSFSSIATTAIDGIIASEKLLLLKSDVVISEKISSVISFTEKGYVNQDVLNKSIKEVSQSKHFFMFLPWLKSIQSISKLKLPTEFISQCQQFSEAKETLPLERFLEKTVGNYCRERALESIGREIDKTKSIGDNSIDFIKSNLKFFLTKKNKKNFAFFLQSQSDKPEIMKKISQEVTTYSVQHEIIPSHEVLKDILINDQITSLIQNKGFNALQQQNVFYAEYGKLIDLSYKAVEKKSSEDKIKEHYGFLKNYIEFNQDHLPVGLCLNRLKDFSKTVFQNGFKELSREMFRYIIQKNNKEIQEEALFFYLWTYLYFNEFKEAQKLAKDQGLLKNTEDILDPRLKFWIAYIYEEMDQKNEAIPLFENVVFNHPLSFYGIMSSKRLQTLKPDSLAVKFYASNSVESTINSPVDLKEIGEDYISSIVRLKSWAKIGNAKLMKIELKRMRKSSIPNYVDKFSGDKELLVQSDLHLMNAKIIQDSDNHLSTFRYLYDILEKKEIVFNRQLLEILYPKPYFEVLSKELKDKGLDPIVVLSLIRQESVFNPLARSPVGARGLMQIMPLTARRLKKSVREKHLANPEVNIELGTKYLKNLSKRYDGNLVYMLSAYNAGESRVERWKNLHFDTDETILKNIESIPFLETRNYVKLIFRNIFFYKLLLDKNNVADSGESNRIFDVHLGFNK